jgi:hypothetical protein
LVEGGKLNAGFVEVDAIVGGVVLQLLVLGAVVDEDPSHF